MSKKKPTTRTKSCEFGKNSGSHTFLDNSFNTPMLRTSMISPVNYKEVTNGKNIVRTKSPLPSKTIKDIVSVSGDSINSKSLSPKSMVNSASLSGNASPQLMRCSDCSANFSTQRSLTHHKRNNLCLKNKTVGGDTNDGSSPSRITPITKSNFYNLNKLKRRLSSGKEEEEPSGVSVAKKSRREGNSNVKSGDKEENHNIHAQKLHCKYCSFRSKVQGLLWVHEEHCPYKLPSPGPVDSKAIEIKDVKSNSRKEVKALSPKTSSTRFLGESSSKCIRRVYLCHMCDFETSSKFRIQYHLEYVPHKDGLAKQSFLQNLQKNQKLQVFNKNILSLAKKMNCLHVKPTPLHRHPSQKVVSSARRIARRMQAARLKKENMQNKHKVSFVNEAVRSSSKMQTKSKDNSAKKNSNVVVRGRRKRKNRAKQANPPLEDTKKKQGNSSSGNKKLETTDSKRPALCRVKSMHTCECGWKAFASQASFRNHLNWCMMRTKQKGLTNVNQVRTQKSNTKT